MNSSQTITPPFTSDSATQKVKLAENLWNTKDAYQVSLAYTEDSIWRNRDLFLKGRDEIQKFLQHKWETELEYRLVKELWCYTDNRIAVRFQYEYHTPTGQWRRAYGNENWEFNDGGLMKRREASINEIAITHEERLLQGPIDSTQVVSS